MTKALRLKSTLFATQLILASLISIVCRAQTAGTIQYKSASNTLEVYVKSIGWKTVGAGTSVGSCTSAQAGTFEYDSSTQLYKYCNATNWISFTVLTTTTACSTAGALNYDGEYNLRFCNGSVWVNATQSTHGYFVMTSTTFTANLGDLSGADAKCLTNLTSNNWLGKSDAQARGTLATAKVRAFLCNSSACANGIPNSTYVLARAGSLTAGGTKITTDANGYGPNTATKWDGTSAFSTTANYWTGRAHFSGTDTTWENAPSSVSCTNFTAVTGDSHYGRSDVATKGRWGISGSALGNCSSSYRLICFVHP